MNAAELKKWLTSNYACTESLEWLSDRDLDTAWAECPRGDWLLWLTAKAGIDRKRLVMSACSTAREALRFVPEGEDRPRIAIETAEAWCRSEATIEQVREARWNAAAYAADAAAAYAADAAAAYAADADAAAAYAAAAAAASSARLAMRRKTAEIVRGLIALDEVKVAMGSGRDTVLRR